VSQAYLTIQIPGLGGGQEAQLDQELKAVADSQNRSSAGVKICYIMDQGAAGSGSGVLEPGCCGLSCPQMVPIQKSARKDQEVKIHQIDCFLDQISEMGNNNFICSSNLAGICSFSFAVGSIAG
jgi:hypothetical protein